MNLRVGGSARAGKGTSHDRRRVHASLRTVVMASIAGLREVECGDASEDLDCVFKIQAIPRRLGSVTALTSRGRLCVLGPSIRHVSSDATKGMQNRGEGHTEKKWATFKPGSTTEKAVEKPPVHDRREKSFYRVRRIWPRA